MDSAFVDYVKKSVTFFFDQDTSNEGVVTPFGTGFFMGVNLEKDPTRGQGYLVSAKHVLLSAESAFISLANTSDQRVPVGEIKPLITSAENPSNWIPDGLGVVELKKGTVDVYVDHKYTEENGQS